MNEVSYISRRVFLKYSGIITASSMFPLYFFDSSNDLRKEVTFGLITDSHYADRNPKGTRFYRYSLQKIEHCISFLNEKNLDFLIHLGDFKDEDVKPNEENTLKYLKTIEKEFSKFNGDRYHVLGNHDVDSITKSQFLEHITNSTISTAKSYYSYICKHIRFIVLDANFSSDGIAYSKGNFDWRDTNIDSVQLIWLQDILMKSDIPCIIFVHQLLDEYGVVDYSIKNRLQVRQVLESSNKVIAVFQGHRHKEVYHRINNIHYYTFNAMVDHQGLENNSFSILTIKKNLDIKIDGYYRSSNQNLKQS